jgi:hypothetical protein
MTKPLYFYNGSSFEQVGPTTPQSPIAYQTSAPTGPATGDLWIDSDGDVDTYNRQLTRYYFVATAAQTTITGTDANGLTLAYVAGSEAVYVNGALQVRGQDYTATNGTSVVMSSALAVNDVVEIFAYTAFTVANTYTQSQVDGFRVGNTLQVVNATTSTDTSESAGTYTDVTNLTASITPSFSTSKILVMVSVNGIHKTATGNFGVSLRLLRDATQLKEFSDAFGYGMTTGSDAYLGSSSFTYYDSPATTSSTTYKVQLKTYGTPNTASVNKANSESSITLMEIKV